MTSPLPLPSASAVIPQYLDALRLSKKSDHTLRTYRHALRVFARILGKNDELSEKNFIKFLQSTAERTERAQITYRVPVSRLYEFYSPGIPVRVLIENYGQDKPKTIIQYNESDLEKLIEYAESLRGDLLALRDRAFILTLADTGLRISEACKLNRSDIAFDKGRAIVIGKGDKPGIIRFSERSLRSIREYLSARAELDGKTGKPLGSLPVFARHDKGSGKKIKRVGSGGMSQAIDRRGREAGISGDDELERGAITAHKLRHRFVTMILRKTGNPTLAQAMARHEDINTTMRYGHLREEHIDESYREIFNQ